MPRVACAMQMDSETLAGSENITWSNSINRKSNLMSPVLLYHSEVHYTCEYLKSRVQYYQLLAKQLISSIPEAREATVYHFFRLTRLQPNPRTRRHIEQIIAMRPPGWNVTRTSSTCSRVSPHKQFWSRSCQLLRSACSP